MTLHLLHLALLEAVHVDVDAICSSVLASYAPTSGKRSIAVKLHLLCSPSFSTPLLPNSMIADSLIQNFLLYSVCGVSGEELERIKSRRCRQ